MTVYVSDEVGIGAVTALVWCDNSSCENAIRVLAKDVHYTTFVCEDCEDTWLEDADASDDFPLWMEYDEGW